jgi:outer membrane biosynthesis protein TonB
MSQIMPDFENEFERAIATYADPGDAGYRQALATRVLAAVNARRRKRHWLLRFAIAVPAFGCLLIVALLHFVRSEPQHQVADVVAISLLPHPATVPPAPSPTKPDMARNEITRHRPHQLPKRAQFPTPAPMTEQERLLVQFATHAPPTMQKQIAKTQQESDAPLGIAELTIPKLDSNSQPK